MTGLAWGPWSNGRIAQSALTAVPNFAALGGQYSSAANGSNLMKTEAAVQLSGLMKAFYTKFKERLVLREGYRPVEPVQNWYYNRFMKKLPGWTLAAFPGTSNHGWGLSADLGVGSANRNFNAVELAWMRTNAPRYGFLNDVVSEVWHWTYRTSRQVVVTKLLTDPQAAALAKHNPSASKKEDKDMQLIRNNIKGDANFGATFAMDTLYVRHIASGSEVEIAQKVFSVADEIHNISTKKELNDIFHSYGITVAAQNPRWVVDHANAGDSIFSPLVAAIAQAVKK